MAQTKIPVYPKQDLYQWGPIRAVPYYLLNPGRAVVQEVYKRYKIQWAEGLMVYFDDNKCLWYNRQSEIDSNGFKAAKLIYKNKASETKLKKRYKDAIGMIAHFRKSLTPETLRHLSDYELWAAYQRVQDAYDVFWSVATLAELAGYGATAYLQTHADRLPAAKTHHDPLHILTSASDLTFYQKEEVEFLYLLEQVKSKLNSSFARQELGKHSQKYNWLLNNFATGKPLPINYFYQRAKTVLKKNYHPGQTADKISRELKLTNQLRRQIVARIRHPETKFYGRIAGDALAWHDDRKGWQMRMETVLHYFLQEFSRRFKAPADFVSHLLPQELAELATGKKRASDFSIAFRRKLMIAYVNRHKMVIVQGAEAKAVVKAYAKLEQSGTKTREFTGLTASTGKGQEITGQAVVIRDASELGKMQTGKILVAQFTSPDYIMAIRKAAAIITDIGGLNSHAAVVSRELGIPCIVNTKLATKILKTGDKVRIDAKQGIIKKLN